MKFLTIWLICLTWLLIVISVWIILQNKFDTHNEWLTYLIAYCGYVTVLWIGFILIIAKEYGLTQ